MAQEARSDVDAIVNEAFQYSCDLMYGNLELGFYGIRELKKDPGTYWAYGTGLALPRIQLII